MKKIYAFLAAALMSASLFAADAPTVAELAEIYNTSENVVLCVNFIDEAQVCNNIYFVGSFSGWAESFDGCAQFRPVANHEGWYAAEAAFTADCAGKPIQAKKDGSFSWDFQTGDVDAWEYVEGLEAGITAGYDGEANVTYASAGVYIYKVKYWKNHRTPCVDAVKHDYTIKLYAPECEDTEYTPAIIGDFNGWSEGVTMDADIDDMGEVVYVATFNDEEGHAFKFRQAGISDWSNQIQIYDEENDKYIDNPNVTLGEETTIVLDYSEGKWSACGLTPCDEETKYEVKVTVKVPEGAPAAGVEIIGGFESSDWVATLMTLNSVGAYEATVTTLECAEFKFREADTWDNEIVDAATGEGLANIKVRDVWNEAKNAIELDFSEGYVWKANYQGIEEVVLTEKARKVVVDGQLYIVRDNKLFNVTGAQVR